MLNLGFDIDINVKKTRMPISFEKKNICVHCGANGSLSFVDKWGKETHKEINAYDHIKCKACGKIYSIRWESNDDGSMFPSATDFNIPNQFKNFVNRNEIKSNALIELD